MNQPADHVLFRTYPLASQKKLSTGVAPVPYHVYDGHVSFVAGIADLAGVKTLLNNERAQPIETTNGCALMAIWVCDFNAASLGPHQELQVSFFVARQTLPPIASQPLTVLKLMLTRPETRLLCHGLWNNTATVVAYNRELLGLNARLAYGLIERDTHINSKAFEFTDKDSGQLIVKGRLRELAQTPRAANWALLKTLGWRQSMAIAAQPWIPAQVMNPIGPTLKINAEAQAYLAADRQVLQLVGADDLVIEFGANVYQGLNFTPQVMQHFSGFKFVYLNPHNAGDTALA
jgi:hypothetical protein